MPGASTTKTCAAVCGRTASIGIRWRCDDRGDLDRWMNWRRDLSKRRSGGKHYPQQLTDHEGCIEQSDPVEEQEDGLPVVACNIAEPEQRAPGP